MSCRFLEDGNKLSESGLPGLKDLMDKYYTINLKEIFSRNMQKRVIIFIVIYALSLSGALYNHISDIFKGGFLPYHYAPFLLNMYWTALTLIEPIAIIAIVLKRKLGVYLCIAIIVSDVFINFFSTLAYFGGFRQLINFYFVCQISFMVFVLYTCQYLLKRMLK
jgi:hypothetical protein